MSLRKHFKHLPGVPDTQRPEIGWAQSMELPIIGDNGAIDVNSTLTNL